MRAFVIAMENEAAVVRPFLKDGDRLYVAGVGKVNAAAATQAVEYDFDLTLINGTKLGTHNERTTPYFDCRTGGKFPARILATGDRFTNDERDVENPLALSATVKDMEGAAIAHVCELNGVPCRMLKCLSDVHGKGAMTGQYKDNLAKALSHLKEALASWIA